MSDAFLSHILATLDDIEAAGLTKRERLLTGPQGGRIRVASPKGAREAVNLCANNYLGLANHPDVVAAAAHAMDEFGFGMASVRFICGAQTLHRELEQAIARHLGKDDAIVFAACFDANGGVFEPLLDEADAIVSDSLNHASIIDGVRLSRPSAIASPIPTWTSSKTGSKRPMRLARASSSSPPTACSRWTGTSPSSRRSAGSPTVMARWSWSTTATRPGISGEKGRGTPALTGAGDRVDIVTGTFGKTLGGGMGGFVAAAQPIVDLLRQRARPYLFSNSLAPPIAAGALKALEITIGADDRRALLQAHARRFRAGVEKAGFKVLPGETPIIPVMLGDARLAQGLAQALDERGVFVAGFFFPVVPKGAARIRTQMSAALTTEDVDFAVSAFADAGKALGIV